MIESKSNRILTKNEPKTINKCFRTSKKAKMEKLF
jgi:hypothetical protein